MNNISYSFFGLINSIIGLSKSFKQKVDVISIERGSQNNLKEYEELSQKQYMQMQSIPKQKSLIKRCDSTLSDLLNMGSDEDDDDDQYDSDNIDFDEFDNSDSDYDFLNEVPSRQKLVKKSHIQQDDELQEDQDNSDGGSVHNFKQNKRLPKE